MVGAEPGSERGIIQAIGVLQGETRANQSSAEHYRSEMISRIEMLDRAVASLTTATGNIEEMRRDYDRRLIQIAGSLAHGEGRLAAIDVLLGRIDARARLNFAWLTTLGAGLGSLFTIAVEYLLRRN